MKVPKKPVPLNNQIFALSFLLSFVMISILTVQFALIFYPRQIDNAKSFLRERNHALSVYVESYFKEIINSSKILSKNIDLIEADYADKEARARILKILDEYKEANENIYYIYAGYTNGLLLINNYDPPPNYDVHTRPWYKAIMDRPYSNAMVVGLLYNEAKTNELLLSTIHVLENPERGFTGVLAIDSYTKAIADQIQMRSGIYDSAYSYITDSEWKILVHPDQELIGKNLFDVITVVSAVNKYSHFYYSYENKKKLAYVNYIPLTNWYLVTTVDETELAAPAVRNLGLYFLTVLALVVVISILNAQIWGRKFMTPLIALRDRVEHIVRAEEEKIEYRFPNNELGQIAMNIEKLTGSALMEKTRKLEAANTKIMEINSELEEKNKLLESLAIHDFLTSSFNRRKLEEILEENHEKYLRYRLPYSLIMYDIDRFKSVNDTFGHQAGDTVLQEVSKLAGENIRKTDVAGRWGGEEFVVILFNTKLETAADVAEKLRLLVQNHQFEISKHITISLGVGEIAENETLDDFIRRTDRYLYKAKETGRNKTVWA